MAGYVISMQRHTIDHAHTLGFRLAWIARELHAYDLTKDRRARGIYLTLSSRGLKKRVLGINGAIQRRLLAVVRPAELDAGDRAFRALETAPDGLAERAMVRRCRRP
jgi:hypothetical protein